MNDQKKFIQCRRDGTARHYTGCLWLCRKPMCEHIQRYADLAFCNIPIREEILKNRAKEREAKNDG